MRYADPVFAGLIERADDAQQRQVGDRIAAFDEQLRLDRPDAQVLDKLDVDRQQFLGGIGSPLYASELHYIESC